MSDRPLNDFVAGFASRHDQAGAALRRAFAAKGVAFSPRDMTPEPPPQPEAQPRHFEPADRDGDPTQGWDPFDATQQPSGFVDPIATAKALGYEEGVAAAMAQVAANAARDRALIDDLTAAINDDRRIDRDRWPDISADRHAIGPPDGRRSGRRRRPAQSPRRGRRRDARR